MYLYTAHADLHLRLPAAVLQYSFNDVLIVLQVFHQVEDIRFFCSNFSGSKMDKMIFSGTPNIFIGLFRLAVNFSVIFYQQFRKTSNLVIDELIINPEDI